MQPCPREVNAGLELTTESPCFSDQFQDVGVRYDYFDPVDTGVQTSPRVGFAYHFTKSKSVLHAAYDRYFSPPPIEYSLLASFLGHTQSILTSAWAMCAPTGSITSKQDWLRNYTRGLVWN